MTNLTYKDFPNLMNLLEEREVSNLAAIAAIERDLNNVGDEDVRKAKDSNNKPLRENQVTQHRKTIGEHARKKRIIK